MSGQRTALIIANDEYDQEALRDLRSPTADAEALKAVLADPQIGDFNVRTVRNEASHIIQAKIEEIFSESRPDDMLLLHFSGHGLKNESGELFFAASNTRPDRLGSTAVPADFLQRCMRDSRSRSIVLLLDCCYGGAFAQGVQVRAGGNVNVLESFPRGSAGRGRGRAVITASSAMEFAFEGSQLGDDDRRAPSVFSAALVEGLATGDADRDEDGWISLDELYNYVFDKVRERNPHQTPSRRFELEGNVYLARSSRRRIRPAPIPADLKAALDDSNMYTRLGAITELRSRLASESLPIAAAAYEILAELAQTGSRYVAGPASEALSEATVRPVPAELHFGRVMQGTAPPHQVIRLLGPPIARACVPRPSDAWIRVAQTDEGLDISIDTASAGLLRGSLGLQGSTGETGITVDAEIISSQHPTSTSASAPGKSAYRTAHGEPFASSVIHGVGSAMLAAVILFSALALGNNITRGTSEAFWIIALGGIVFGVLVTGFERPFKRLRTLAHGWNFIFFACLAIVMIILSGKSHWFSGTVDGLTALLAGGAAGNAVCAALVVLNAKGARSASNATIPIVSGLISLALIGLALDFQGVFFMADLGYYRSVEAFFYAASSVSFVESFLMFFNRFRSKVGLGV